jgi:hypothetical protein
MSNFKTPGVYIKEQDAFSSSVVAVPTAVPAFIGYTERANRGQTSLTNVPTRVTSLAEYQENFGGGPITTFKISKSSDGSFDLAADENTRFMLYNSMRLFFANGGGSCYIVSVGGYDYKKGVDPSDLNGPGKGLDTLAKEQEPTMVLCPDAVLCEEDDCYSLYQQMIQHCGARMKSRIAIVDVYGGENERLNDELTVETFRNKIGNNTLAFCSSYYPWLNTTIVGPSEVDYRSISNADGLIKLLKSEAAANLGGGDSGPNPNLAKAQKLIGTIDAKNVDDVVKELKKLDAGFSKGKETDVAKIQDALNAHAAKAFGGSKGAANPKLDAINTELDKLASHDNYKGVGQTVSAISPTYKEVLKGIREKLNVLPPAAAMAGVYALVDSQEGVHKAPANVSLSAVVSPTQNITAEDQENLNMPLNGKAVNAIRSFVGKGVLVWGARTLDGNSQDWRYINVRRTLIMIEQSIKNSVESYVFEPNVARTWIKVKTSIDNFLTEVWKNGALAGSSASEAFEVSVGLGSTMTPVDILEGVMRVSIKVAITRPAEFIELTFQQKMQES